MQTNVSPPPLRRSGCFPTALQGVALLAIAAPVGALTMPVLGHPYGLWGAVVFVVSGVILLRRYATHPARWHLLLAACLAGVATTAALHFRSVNLFIVENASGQAISRVTWHTDAWSFDLHHLPRGAVVRAAVRALLYNGRGNANVQLSDGTSLNSSGYKLEGKRYRRTTKIRVTPGGVNVELP